MNDDPEQAFANFANALANPIDDETLIALASDLGVFLAHHWDAFHERVETLVQRAPRFLEILGQDFFDPKRFRDEPVDPEELIRAHFIAQRHTSDRSRVDDLMERNTVYALAVAIEIVHRYEEEGPLIDLLRSRGPAVIDEVERIARESRLVRRALWQIRGLRREIVPEVWQRIVAVRGDATGGERSTPPPQTLAPHIEANIAGWRAYEQNEWAFWTLNDMVRDEPEEAWPIIRALIERAEHDDLGYIAAGPLEDLLHHHFDAFFDRVAAEARTNPRFAKAIRGVYNFEPRYAALILELDERGR
jgi:hypothetical protein